MNPTVDVATYLQTLGLGSIAGIDPLKTPIYISNLPDDIDNAILIDSTSGNMPNQYYGLYHAQLEIWVRFKDTELGYSKARAILTALNRKANLSLASCYVYYMQPLTDVEGLGRDNNNRSLHKLLVDLTYREIIS